MWAGSQSDLATGCIINGMLRASLVLALVGTLVLAACTTAGPTQSPIGTYTPVTSASPPAIVDYPPGSLPAFLASDGRFGIFLALMERDGFLLDRLLAAPGTSFTLFAPIDAAFASLTATTEEGLEADESLITGIVERHFLARRLPSAEFASAYVFAGMSRRSSRMALVVDSGRIWYGDARVIDTDLRIAGGLVHVIDGVNLGPTPERRPVP